MLEGYANLRSFASTPHKYHNNGCFAKLQGARPPDEPVTVFLPDHLAGVFRLPCIRVHHGPLWPTPAQRHRTKLLTELYWTHQSGNRCGAWDEACLVTPQGVHLFSSCDHALALYQTIDEDNQPFVDFFLDTMHAFDYDDERFFCLGSTVWWERRISDSPTSGERALLEHLKALWFEELPVWCHRARARQLRADLELVEMDTPAVRQVPQPRSSTTPRTTLRFTQLKAWEARRSTRSIDGRIEVLDLNMAQGSLSISIRGAEGREMHMTGYAFSGAPTLSCSP